MTDCSRAGAGQGDGSGARYEQIVFSFGEDVTPTLRFDAAAVTADAGLAPLRELDERLGLTALAATFVDDHARQVRRDPGPNGAQALAPRRGAPGPTAASSRMSRAASPTNDWPLYLSGMPAGALVPRLPPPPSSHSFEGKVCHNDKVCAGVACPNDNPALPGRPAGAAAPTCMPQICRWRTPHPATVKDAGSCTPAASRCPEPPCARQDDEV